MLSRKNEVFWGIVDTDRVIGYTPAMNLTTVMIVIVLLPLTAVAHPGKTDRQGGHRCLKDCAEWDLYYNEYHLHDKDGKPAKVARKKPVRSKPETATVEAKAVIEEKPADRPAEATPSQPVAAAALPDIGSGTLSLSWLLLVLFLLLFLVVRRNRRKASGAERTVIS